MPNYPGLGEGLGAGYPVLTCKSTYMYSAMAALKLAHSNGPKAFAHHGFLRAWDTESIRNHLNSCVSLRNHQLSCRCCSASLGLY